MGCTVSRKKKHPLSEIRNFSRMNINVFYRFGRILGSGSFGTVKLAYSIEQERNGQTSTTYAVKTIDKQRMGNRFHMIQRELEILAQLDHPNIIRVYEEYEDARYYHFVMEYCRGGELFERVIKKGAFSEKKTQVLMKQLFSAVQYMHIQGITHRDLKPENLMLVSPDDDYDVRIIDFGLSKKYPPPISSIEGRSKVRQQTRVGTPIYVAPEVLTSVYSQTCDEWALGCIMYVLLCGEPPFFSNNVKSLEKKIINDKVQFREENWRNISLEAKELIIKLLEKNPKKRITCSQSLQSSWVKKFDKVGLMDFKQTTTIQSNAIMDIPLENEKTLKLLKTFGNISKMKKETLKILLNQLNEQQIQGLRVKFEIFDKDNSGTVSVQELLEIMREAGLNDTENQIKEMVKKFTLKKEITKEFVIHYSEFMVALLNQSMYLNEERLWMLFKQFDVDDKSYITRQDVKRALERRGRVLHPQKLESIFMEINNHNNNGMIFFEDFKNIMWAESLDSTNGSEKQKEKEKEKEKEQYNISQNIYKYLDQPKGDFNYNI